MLVDKNAVLQVFGSLLKHPQYLSETEKYCLTSDDFTSTFEKIIFSSIYNLYLGGAEKVTRIDIDNYLKDYPSSYETFNNEKGIDYLYDAELLSQEENFPYYYKRIKKFSCLRQLKKMGYNTEKFYNENPLNIQATKANENFDKLEVSDIFAEVKKGLMKLESDFNSNENNETRSAISGLDKLIIDLGTSPEIGSKLQGDIFNTIVKGARKGKYYIRSAGTGVGKTRSLVGDACYIAYPIRYNSFTNEWEQNGDSEKVLFIATEQNFDEIQTMILAYLTDINEDRIILGKYTEEERDRIRKAIYIMNEYKDNFLISRMPNPDITQIKAIIRQNYIVHDIQNVFYDYIFSSPSLLSEFRDLKIREDVALLMLSTALKDLAVELDIFVMSATQLNADAEEKKGIKNQSVLRGSKAIADKADVACISTRCTQEELNILNKIILSIGTAPNQVTDVYKVRRGRWTEVRVWSEMNLGTCRKKDLFITDGVFNNVQDFSIQFTDIAFEQDSEKIEKILEKVNNGLECVSEKVVEKKEWNDLL